MMMQCCHPNIVECSEAFYSREEGKLYIVMEFATRGDLFNDLKSR